MRAQDHAVFTLPVAFDRAKARQAFARELARLDARLHREILRLRARYELTLDEFRGLYVSDAQVDELLRSIAALAAGDTLLAAEAAVALADAELTAESVEDTPWNYLCERLELSRLECDLLLAVLAPELDPKYETLFAYLNNDVTRRWPTVELAGRLFALDKAELTELRGIISPGHRLMTLGLIEHGMRDDDQPRSRRALRVAAPLADWLLGLPYCDERLVGAVRLVSASPSRVSMPMTAEFRSALAQISNGAHLNIVALGSSSEEAVALAERLFIEAGMPALTLDLNALHTSPAPLDLISAVHRVAALFGLGLVVSPVEALLDIEGRPFEAGARAARVLSRRGHVCVWAGASAHWRDVLGVGEDAVSCQLVRVPEIDVHARGRLWRELLGDDVEDVDVGALADRFVFGAARIERAYADARARMSFDGEEVLSSQYLFDAARTVSAERVTGLTRSVQSPHDWEQLVLPGPVKRRLHDVVCAVSLRPQVLDTWGFAERIPNARGVKVMFAGPSGTGKSMAAGIIAKTLGFDVHRVELAAVVSKYIGETEKNLDRAFDAARRSNAVLFIDEADALFGKRSEVRDAHDRYANIETAYLLQKMEDHEGVVIVATNLAHNLDEAFSRRMNFIIEFPMPDIASRERLWRGLLPASAPLSEDVDIAFLARQFTFAGGDIRNVVLDAAYMAAQERGSIGMRHFLSAVARQFAKRGKVPTIADFREHFSTLNDASLLVHERNGAARVV